MAHLNFLGNYLPRVYPVHLRGTGEGFAANSHRFAPGGMLTAVKYLVEELHVDVNAADHEGNTAPIDEDFTLPEG